jgi:hypothetical protein
MTNHPIRRNNPSLLHNQGDGNFQFAQQEKNKIQTLLQMLEVDQLFLEKSRSRSAQTIFHSIFTSFQRHIAFPEDVFVQAQNAIENTTVLKVPAPLCNNHIFQCNLEVLSWTKPVKAKNEIGQYDDNIGEDFLSSQSTMYTTSKMKTTCYIFLLHQCFWQQKQ